MSECQLGRAARVAALLLASSCAGAHTGGAPAGGAPAASESSRDAIRFEDLPLTRLSHASVPTAGAENPSLGPSSARVVVQVWSDFECPFCADAHAVLAAFMRESASAGNVRLVWHDYPLPSHPHARIAATAAEEAFAQGGPRAFWAYHDLIYESSSGNLDPVTLERFAQRVGLDTVRFAQALSDHRHDPRIDADIALGDTLGVRGTPAFLVNDYFFTGVAPIEVFRVIVEHALAE
jgi:protein-disulfide isomerase